VSFDTTFQTNKFEMSFPQQTIIFETVLLFDETIPLFILLFEFFLLQ
jgi:hypothetical protein